MCLRMVQVWATLDALFTPTRRANGGEPDAAEVVATADVLVRSQPGSHVLEAAVEVAPKNVLDMLIREYFAPRLGQWSGGRGTGPPILDAKTLSQLAATAAASESASAGALLAAPAAAVAAGPPNAFGGFGPFAAQKLVLTQTPTPP